MGFCLTPKVPKLHAPARETASAFRTLSVASLLRLSSPLVDHSLLPACLPGARDIILRATAKSRLRNGLFNHPTPHPQSDLTIFLIHPATTRFLALHQTSGWRKSPQCSRAGCGTTTVYSRVASSDTIARLVGWRISRNYTCQLLFLSGGWTCHALPMRRRDIITSGASAP